MQTLEGECADMSSSSSSTVKTLVVATLLCIVCASLVSSISVSLKDEQLKNKKLDKQRNILLCAGEVTAKEAKDKAKVDEAFKNIKPKLVDMQYGYILDVNDLQSDTTPQVLKDKLQQLEAKIKSTDKDKKQALQKDIDALKTYIDNMKKLKSYMKVDKDGKLLVGTYDQVKASKDKDLSIDVQDDKGSTIKTRAKFALVYLVQKDNEKVSKIILPVKSYGLWSTMLGFLALDVDTTTIKGFAYYEHGETPGLGGEVDNKNWKAQWPGKKAYNSEWEPAIHVIKGKVDPQGKNAEYKIDGLSGATITSVGVSTSLEYWLSESGFGLFLENIREKGFQ